MKLKTRTNQPVYYKLPVSSNIQSLSDDLLNSLRVGDVVQKKTGNQKHCYIVTYKEEKKGICLTYTDCGYMETISYDYTAGHWVFNSKDVCEVASKSDVKLENIEDDQGHKRFIDANGTQLIGESLSNSYCKWSLSGSHLMIVLAGVIADTTELSSYQLLAQYSLPDWIYNKIYPVWASVYIEATEIVLRGSDWSEQKLPCVLEKDAGNLLTIISINGTPLTLTANRGFRVSFDLLIDNESE